jgi:two-component system chemotaxis response regulator CheY
MLKKIAVVDDSELLHRMYALVLMRYRAAGAVIVSARDGLEFLQLMQEHADIDLVLLDVNMPKMGGLDVMRRLRSSPRLKTMKVMMVSTEGREADVQQALSLGASGYVTKPFSPSDLHARIETLFPGASHASRETREAAQ